MGILTQDTYDDLSDNVEITDLTEDVVSDDLSDQVSIEDIEPTWSDKFRDALPSEFIDWLYEAERSNLGDVDIGTYDDNVSVMDITEPSEGKWDRTSDALRAAIQTGAYMGDFWKDLAMIPYNLAFDKEKPFARLWEHPKWAEDIGYESDWGQSFMEDERVRWIQENLLPYAGPGIVAKTGLSGILRIPKVINKIPGLRKILETVYPTTMKGFKQGLMPAIRPGNIPFNVGLPYLWNQIGKKVKGEPTDYERGWQNLVAENTNFSPISSAHAADVPSRGDYAAGPMDYLQTPRPVTQRHPREMMEQSYNVRRSPELTTQSDYERLQQENIAAGKPRYLAHGA